MIFGQKQNWGSLKKINFQLFYEFYFFHIFLVKVLNLILTDQNRNMHIIARKDSRVELHSSKTSF